MIARFKLNSILALLIAALLMGLAAGMKPATVADSFQNGLGKVLGGVAMVIGLGAILGKMLAESGGAEVIADRIAKAFGARRIEWAVSAAAIVVGIPTFFYVGMVLLLPIVFSMVYKSKSSTMKLGVPLIAALSCMHSMVPPHPGPMVVIDKLHAEVGKAILFSLVVAIPAALVAGPLYGNWLVKRVKFDEADRTAAANAGVQQASSAKTPPGFALSVFTIFLPILLMLIKAAADIFLVKDSAAHQWCGFFGGPLNSMLIAVLFSFYSFGYLRGFNRDALLKFSNDCLGPMAAMLLVVGSGGGFNQVLQDGGIGKAIEHYAAGAALSPLALGWLVAALMRIAVGSSTVAITAAAGILGPMVAGRSDVNLELLVVAMGAGSLIMSHVNDGGFWIVKEMFGLTVSQTLKTWTVATTLASVLALFMILGLSKVL